MMLPLLPAVAVLGVVALAAVSLDALVVQGLSEKDARTAAPRKIPDQPKAPKLPVFSGTSGT